MPGSAQYNTFTVVPPTSNNDRLIKVVEPGLQFYAVLVESLGVEPIALRFGDASQDFVRVITGDTFDFGTKGENRGLWVYWPRFNFDSRLVLTVFFEPTFKARSNRRDVWDLASRHGSSLQVIAAAGQRAGIGLLNFDPANFALVTGQPTDAFISPQLVRLDDLIFWANIATTIRVMPVVSSSLGIPPAQLGTPWNFPLMLGVSPGPVVLGGGVDPVIAAVSPLIQPIPVGANEKVALGDLAADIEMGYGVMVRVEDFAATLSCSARWRAHIVDYAKG